MDIGFEAGGGGTERLPLLRMEMGGSPSSAESDASLTAESDAALIVPLRANQDDVHPAATEASEAEAEAEDAAFDPGRQVVSLLKPVSLTMVLVVYLVRTLGSPDSLEGGGFSGLMVYQEQQADSTSTKAGGVLLNALAMVALLAMVTTFMMLLYKYRCYRLMYGWLLFSVASLLFSFGGLVLQQLLETFQVATDRPTLTLFLYNFSAVGTLLVFWRGLGLGASPPRTLQQAYLVAVSGLIAWSATRLPEWTTWGVLAAVSAWDLVAVLTPRGPLKLMVEEAERRAEPIPGLVYEGDEIKLGLGDFIFYSLLVGRASLRGAAATVSCAVAVLSGLCATLALLPVFQRALPALPISIAAGTACYFAATLLVAPLAEFGAANCVLI
mmetsp:Transcript_18341/g.37377  ORF Transcript_18341/g.37377 Transcript_18341/m.37377 type:complete len:384 (+) Transcript_18341:74-1225(+)